MKPPGHAVISLSIGGALWVVTKSPYSLVAAFITGVMIDIDHLVEYYNWFIREDDTRLYYFLHSYELLAPAFLAGYMSGWDPIVLGVSFAFLGHLIADQLANPVTPLTYFITYRAMKGFRRREIIKVDWDTLERDFLHVPITRTLLGIFNPRLRVGKPRPAAPRPDGTGVPQNPGDEGPGGPNDGTLVS